MQSPPRALQKRDSYIMTLCLVSATDPYGVTVSCTPALASCLDSALAKNASANAVESAVTKSLDLKSPEINTYRKCGGSPLLASIISFASFASALSPWPPSLPVYRCSSVFICGFTFCLRSSMSPKPKQKQDNRCQHTTADGRRCRMPRRNDDSSLCLDHWQREQQLYAGSVDAETLAAELLGSFKDFKTTTAVNHALGKLFALLAKNLIPVRNAAVLAYIGQLLLHSLSGVKNETMRSRGPDAWLQIIRRALQNESRKPATSQLARTIPQAAIPPEEETSVPS